MNKVLTLVLVCDGLIARLRGSVCSARDNVELFSAG